MQPERRRIRYRLSFQGLSLYRQSMEETPTTTEVYLLRFRACVPSCSLTGRTFLRIPMKKQTKDSFLRSLRCSSQYEDEAYDVHGAQHVCGIDECARGNWLGPTVSSAIILPRDLPKSLDGQLRDSKLIGSGKRKRLAAEIKACAIAWNVAEVSAEILSGFSSLFLFRGVQRGYFSFGTM